jgi:hypothetical protein
LVLREGSKPLLGHYLGYTTYANEGVFEVVSERGREVLALFQQGQSLCILFFHFMFSDVGADASHAHGLAGFVEERSTF